MTSSREIPNPLEQRASELGCRIDVMLDEEMEEGIDYGPYRLCDAESGACIWVTGLPLEGLADALDRLERELQLPAEKIGDAWTNFGCSWAARYASTTARPRHG